MGLPPALRPAVAPPPAPRAPCAVTGGAAPYRDPATGTPYANAAAFAALRGGRGVGGGAPPAVVPVEGEMVEG